LDKHEKDGFRPSSPVSRPRSFVASVVQIPESLADGLLEPRKFVVGQAGEVALPLNPSTTPGEIIASSSEPAEDKMPVSLCGDKIPSCRGSAS